MNLIIFVLSLMIIFSIKVPFNKRPYCKLFIFSNVLNNDEYFIKLYNLSEDCASLFKLKIQLRNPIL